MQANEKPTIGILHPGAMGVSVAATIKNSGYEVLYASSGRSEATRTRAEHHGLTDAGTVPDLVAQSDVIVSVCPPHAAEFVADEAIMAGFSGLYIDANAISPQKAARIEVLLNKVGASLVDGGIIGGPAWEPASTWLYLSGDRAYDALKFFAAGPLEAEMIDGGVGAASALKMCYAAYTKGTSALIAAILALAEQLNVRGDLARQWARDDYALPAQHEQRARRVTAKAWRFAGEMDEIAETFAGAGLPDGFHRAAGDIYRRIAQFKDAPDTPPLHEVIAALLTPPDSQA